MSQEGATVLGTADGKLYHAALPEASFRVAVRSRC